MRSPALTADEYDPAKHRVSKPRVELLVDSTGGGRAVTDLLKSRGLRFKRITITGGEKAHRSGGESSVPKRDLVAALEVPFHTGELRVAEGLEL